MKISLCHLPLAFLVFTAALFTGCGKPADGTDSSATAVLTESSAPSASSEQNIDLYVGGGSDAWTLTISDPDERQLLTGQSAALTSKKVQVSTAPKTLEQDALKLVWKNTWFAGLRMDGDTPVDLRNYMAQGVLSLDLNVIELAKGGLSFKMSCGNNCERKVPFTDQAFSLIGQGWQTLRFSLACFAQDGDDFSAVSMPFAIDAGGVGEIAVANIQILPSGEANATCPDYKTVSVTPSMLNEYWARDWWEPRHQEKLQRIKQGNVDLLMIGDSITEGWAKEGKASWEKYYAKRNAVNLGYGGDRTENVLWRLQHGEVDGIQPKVAVLMIGTNNTGHRLEKPQYTANGIKTILSELQTRLPETKILLLAIFPRDEQPDTAMRKVNNEINRLIANYADNERIFFLDIGQEFLDSDGRLAREVMPDLLHLNEASYATWASAMEPTLKQLMGE